MGKTLSLTYQALRNYLYMKDCKKCHTRFNIDDTGNRCSQCGNDDISDITIYSNYNLNFPHQKIESFEDFEHMQDGFAALDEFWIWADSRESMGKKNKLITAILVKSRRRSIEIGYTAQHQRQVDVRVRRVTDFIARPVINKQRGLCDLYIFQYYDDPVPFRTENFIKRFRFKIEPVYNMYNTLEDIGDIKMKADD